MSKHFSKGMSHSARAANDNKQVSPPEERPLTRKEYEAARRAEEAANRQKILDLRKGWEEHQLQVRMAEIRKDSQS